MEELLAKATRAKTNSLRVMPNQYFGNYRGTVLNNEDPLNRGRCKVYVPTVYHEKFKADKGKKLPWAEPAQPLFSGGMGDDGKNGTFQCPDMGSTVWLFFESGDITRPIMFAQTTDENGKFSTKHCTFKWEKMWIDLCRDKDEGTNIITIHADTTINEDAVTTNINETAGTDITEKAGHDITETADNDIFDKASNNITNKAGVDITIDAGSNIVIKGGSSIKISAPTIDISGSTVNISGGSGDCKINGISLVNHTHPVPPHCPGAGMTLKPV